MAPRRLIAGLCAALCAVAVQAAGHSGNPFLDRPLYVNPVNSHEFSTSIATASGQTRQNLQRMQRTPSAYWIDVKAKIRGTAPTSVEGILRNAASRSPPELVVLIWYDLPNRDCDAKASNGEICCSKNSDGTCDYLAPGDCAEGLREYTTEYVDPFAAVLKEYEGRVPVVVVMEPDGLANLATNIADPHCGNEATQIAYKKGVKYAVEQLATQAPSVAIYLDAAHGGWLGWENNLEDFMKTLKSMQMPVSKIRGFATNVANYQALGIQCPWCPDQGTRNGYCLNGKHKSDPCCEDPCNLLSQYNFGNNELNYAAGLVAAARAVLGMEAHVIIDTGRNGVTDQRQDCANWCNPRGAGAGVPSTTETANTSLVDAYFWLKTPGESDGCSQELPDGSKCPRFDSKCSSVDSLSTKSGEPKAPEAGHWFDYQVKELAANAHFDPPPTHGHSGGACPSSGFSPPPAISAGGGSTVPAVIAGTSGSTSAAGTGTGGRCAAAYAQCGGMNWAGPSCCEAGCACSGSGGYYKQCVPSGGGGTCAAGGVGGAPVQNVGSGGTALSSTLSGGASSGAIVPLPSSQVSSASAGVFPAVSAATRPPALLTTVALRTTQPPSQLSTPQVGQCSVAYGQCGGRGWTGPTCCDAYCTCQFRSEDRSECVPAAGNAAGHGPGAVAVIMRKYSDSGPVILRRAPSTGAIALWAAVPVAVALVALAAIGLRRLRPEPRHAGRDASGLAQALHKWLPLQRCPESMPCAAEEDVLRVEVA